MTNRLISETSPYLLKHAENPVDKAILLSIGYSACHWCHVMERECFESQDIARIMNENFINIKVDREERPDLDAVYMEAVQALTGRGGWPLTVFLTPETKPFYGGTYFPPQDRGGMPSFPRVLDTVSQAYRTRKNEVESAAEQVIAHLNQTLEVLPSVEPLTTDVLSTSYGTLKGAFDHNNGGFGSAPKFPQPMALEFLLRYYHRTGDKDALSMVERTLERMASGGIYDQIGGGFHRYSVDDHWLVPHFEKMLYDNALLSRLYLHAYQATGKSLYRRIVEETLDYVLREMRDKDGGFYSTQDADSEGTEGKYYVWTPDEVLDALGGDETGLARRYFGVTAEGNYEGRSILTQAIGPEALASELGVAGEQMEARIATAKRRLLAKRTQRAWPHRDEKVLADWNGLMLASIAEAASVLDRDDYLEAAISNASFLMQTLVDGDLLKHSYKDGQAKGEGYLLDYALLCEGLLYLYQATFQERWLRNAMDLGNALQDRFWDESRGCFSDTSHSQEALIVRPRNIYDNAMPSGSSAAAFVLMRLARLIGDNDYETKATAAMRSVREPMMRYPLGFGHWLCALDFYLSHPKEIAVVGQPRDPATKSLMAVINREYLPNKVLAGRDPGETAQTLDIPLLRDRGMMVEGGPTVYLCQGYVCQTPVSDSGTLATVLDRR